MTTGKQLVTDKGNPNKLSAGSSPENLLTRRSGEYISSAKKKEPTT